MPITLPPAASLWRATAPQAHGHAALHGDHSARIAIIGAGYTGLSAALHLAEAGHDVVVLEASQPGWGASGRNGGQVIAGVKHDPETLRHLFGEDTGRRLIGMAGAAPDLVFDLIARHAIDCDPVRTGWLQLAVSAATAATLEARARQWRAEGTQCLLLDQAETALHTGTGAYQTAMLDPRGGTIQPLAYAEGLAAAALRAGARLFGDTKVTALRPQPGGFVLTTPSGTLTADRVVLATNAYADRLDDGLRRSIVTVPSWQVATAPLPDSIRQTILPGRQSGSDMRRLLRYFRLDAAGRFVLGSRGAFADPQPDSAVRRLCAAAVQLFPQLEGVAFTHHWGGMVAVTQDHLPHLHVLAPGLFAGLGYNGRGVALATAMGAELAKLAAGLPPEQAAFPVSPLRPMRLHAASRLGARAAIAWYRFLDGAA